MGRQRHRARAAARGLGLVVGLAALAVLATGCGEMQVEDFAGREPAFVLEEWFSGPAEGWGVMQSRFGTLQRQFRITARGEWDAATRTLRLVETYRFDDGTEDRLDWSIRRGEAGGYEGSEAHLVGSATGRQAGNAFHWTYTRRAPSAGGTRLDFDDWFWLQPDGVLIVRASVRRFGVEVATMSVFYRRVADGEWSGGATVPYPSANTATGGSR